MIGEVPSTVINDGQLTAGADPWVDSENGFRSKRGREEQLADILGKDLDRGLVRDLFQGAVDLSLDAGLDIDAKGQPGRPQKHLCAQRVGNRAGSMLELGEQHRLHLSIF